MQQEVITLGGGCFWCLEAVFDDLIGVSDVVSGYMGGSVKNPSYRAVCNGTTGHAEVIQVTFDPEQIALDDLLDVFFVIHDPTTLNRQGADVGTQYRSAVFYHSPEQKAAADAAIARASAEYSNSIVTEVSRVDTFYPAEEYHQEYFANNPAQPYCMAVVAPKVRKFRKSFQQRAKSLQAST